MGHSKFDRGSHRPNQTDVQMGKAPILFDLQRRRLFSNPQGVCTHDAGSPPPEKLKIRRLYTASAKWAQALLSRV